MRRRLVESETALERPSRSAITRPRSPAVRQARGGRLLQAQPCLDRPGVPFESLRQFGQNTSAKHLGGTRARTIARA